MYKHYVEKISNRPEWTLRKWRLFISPYWLLFSFSWSGNYSFYHKLYNHQQSSTNFENIFNSWILVTDNGSNVVSDEFKCYLAENRIEYTRVTPYWARANGLVENFNKSLKKAISVATIERKNWKEELYNFLLNYRATLHTTTGRTPSELLFNIIIKTKLSQVIKSRVPRSLKTRDAQRKS